MYPQPATTALHISYRRGTSGAMTLTLYDMTGRCVRTLVDESAGTAGLHTLTISTGSLTAGMYFLQMMEHDRMYLKTVAVGGSVPWRLQSQGE